ncbi:MAG: hypothetical protein HKO56_00700 [Bacteroidia bacterium]|nr:hypothetical protein [Bacteroidia bacterium]
MKKCILFFTVLLFTIGLMAFGYMNWDNPPFNSEKSCANTVSSEELSAAFLQSINNEKVIDFSFDLGSKYDATISKQDLLNAETANDIIPNVADWSVYPINSMKVTLFTAESTLSETGKNITLTKAQTSILQLADYANNVHLLALSEGVHKKTGKPANHDLNYYVSIVPEKEAEYSKGNDALIKYLEQNSIAQTMIASEDVLRTGNVKFTIDKYGKMINVTLGNSCGYDSIDDTVIRLLKSLPDPWNPAATSDGENIEQHFDFIYGMVGC